MVSISEEKCRKAHPDSPSFRYRAHSTTTMHLKLLAIAILLAFSTQARPETAATKDDVCKFFPPGYKCGPVYQCKADSISRTGHLNGPPPGWKAPDGIIHPPGWVDPLPLKNVTDMESAMGAANVPLLDCSGVEDETECELMLEVGFLKTYSC